MDNDDSYLVEVDADGVGGGGPADDGARRRDEEHVVVDVVLQGDERLPSENLKHDFCTAKFLSHDFH